MTFIHLPVNILRAALLLSMLVSVAPTFAQSPDEHFKSGEQYLSSGNYVNAMISFSAALQDKYLISGKNLPLAHSNRAKAIVNVYLQSFEKGDTAFVKNWPDILLIAHRDIEEIHRYNNGKLNKLIAETEEHLVVALELYGRFIADKIRYEEIRREENEAWLATVVEQMELLDRLKPDHYPVKDMLGMLAFCQEDHFKALKYFKESEMYYRNAQAAGLDLNHLYTRYFTALINYQKLINLKESLSLLKETERQIHAGLDDFQEADRNHAMLLEQKMEHLEFQLKLLGDH